MSIEEVNSTFGNIDIYLLDQILKGRFNAKGRLLDAGCGEGRNLKYFVDNGFEVFGNDIEPLAIRMAQMTYRSVPKGSFLIGPIEDLNYTDQPFDVILCGAVLHFARDQQHFDIMLNRLTNLLSKSGILFIRMATTVGMSKKQNSPFTYLLPEEKIQETFASRGLYFVEPWKSVVVEGQRSMGTFILSKN